MNKINRATVLLLIATMTLMLASCHINVNTKPAEKPEAEEKQEEQEKTKDPTEDILKAVVPPEDFELAGEYQDETSQRATMTITPEGEDHYRVEITWADSAAEVTVWTFEGDFDYDGGILGYKNCRKDIDYYGDDGEKEDIVYENGTGALMYYEDGLHWQDDKEDAGKGCHFVKTGELDNVVIEDE